MAWQFSCSGEHWLLELSNGALSSLQHDEAPSADIAITVDRPTLEAVLQQRLAPLQAISEGRLHLTGNQALLASFFGLLDRFAGNFPVVDAAPWPAGPG
jgi:alkyl sulfatase BDS1-like metallo-beta-lactamase superfamily hydrolase